MLSGAKDPYWASKAKEASARRKKTASLFDRRTLRDLKAGHERWVKEVYSPWVERSPEGKERYETASGLPLKPVYTPDDIASLPQSELALPGVYPYTRGVYPSMYRGRQWTMRMFSGYGTPEDTNKRLKLLLEHGETGLSVAFDMPTLYGYDCDSPKAHGEVGRCGVNVSSLRDMEAIFSGIPLGEVSTSMTINAPAAVLTAMYAAVARERGILLKSLRGTVQADMLKEYIAQKEWVYPPEAHLRIVRDMMLYCTKHMPQWNYVSISGYHIREAGSSAAQELAFTLADGF
ncbi:MAG TPA: methylmalonyl-CoA mutase family protein, partial [Nitrososphaerales archaeon]|nr:methylmalonyl-CoA mutase family protein [Nitrososphaerales archaeon]